MNRTEKIVLGIYFCILIFDYIIGFERFQFNSNIGLVLFFTIFIPAFAIHSSTLGTSLRKKSFSLLWMIISILISLIPYDYYGSFSKLFHRDSFPFMLPIVGFVYHQIIRFIYKLILKREPITLWVKYFDQEYDRELKRLSDKYDVIFSLISFLGFFSSFIMIIAFSK